MIQDKIGGIETMKSEAALLKRRPVFPFEMHILFQAVCSKINERTNLGRNHPALLVNQMNGARGWFMIRQHRLQTARCHMWRHLIRKQTGQSLSLKGHFDDRIVRVHVYARTYSEFLRFSPGIKVPMS